jgi:hypothetical protein
MRRGGPQPVASSLSYGGELDSCAMLVSRGRASAVNLTCNHRPLIDVHC